VNGGNCAYVARGTDAHVTNASSVYVHHTYTSGYATWFTAGGTIRIAHYDVIDDVITRKL